MQSCVARFNAICVWVSRGIRAERCSRWPTAPCGSSRRISIIPCFNSWGAARAARRTVIFSQLSTTALAGLLFALFATGCDRGPKLVPAGGTVKYKSALIPGADVVFVPDGDGQPAIGRTDDQGQFTLMTS